MFLPYPILFGLSSMAMQSAVYSTAGSFSFVVPPKVKLVFITKIGGGCGGGGGHSTGGAGGGGGAATALIGFPLAVTPGSTLSLVVGAKGTGGAVENNGTAGTESTVTGGLHLVPQAAPPGAGGSAGAGTNGGAGGATYTFPSGNTDSAPSGDADNGSASTAKTAGSWVGMTFPGFTGGAGAGTGSGNGGNGRQWTGANVSGGANIGGGSGGGSLFGTGGAGGATTTAGSNASGAGAGGGGGGQNRAGGDGTDGMIVIYWAE